jgi:hypothetical protein
MIPGRDMQCSRRRVRKGKKSVVAQKASKAVGFLSSIEGLDEGGHVLFEGGGRFLGQGGRLLGQGGCCRLAVLSCSALTVVRLCVMDRL